MLVYVRLAQVGQLTSYGQRNLGGFVMDEFTSNELLALECVSEIAAIRRDMEEMQRKQAGTYSPYQNPAHAYAVVASDVRPGASLLQVGVKEGYSSVASLEVLTDIREDEKGNKWFDVAYVTFDGRETSISRSASDSGITPYWVNDHPTWNPYYVTFVNDEPTRRMAMEWLIGLGHLATAQKLALEYPELAEKLP